MQSIQQKIEGMLRFGKEELAALEGVEGLEPIAGAAIKRIAG